MSKFFEDLKAGLQDAIAYEQGKLDLRSETIVIPDPPVKYKAKDIKKLRKKQNYSQSLFARILNVSVKMVRSWESGQRVPSHVALRLLEIVDKSIYPVDFLKK